MIINNRVGSFRHFTFKKRELFDKKRISQIIRSLLRSVLGLGLRNFPTAHKFHKLVPQHLIKHIN